MTSVNTEGSNVREWRQLKSSPTSGSAYSLASGNQSGGGSTNTGKGIGGFLKKVGKFLTTPASEKIYEEFAEPYLNRKKEEGIDVYGPGDEEPRNLRGTGDNQAKGPLSIDENFEPHEWAKYKSFEDLTAYSQKLHDQAAAFDASRRASADPTTDAGKSTLSFLDKYQVYKGGNPWVNTDQARREYEQGRQEYLAYNFQKQMAEKNMTDGYEVAGGESPYSDYAARSAVESGQIPSYMTQSQIRSILAKPGRTSDYHLDILRGMLKGV
jgi:hypothetical protein